MGSRPSGEESRGGRTGPRLIAAAALLAGVAIVVVVLLLVGGRGGDGAPDSAPSHRESGDAASASRAELPTIAAVRNARPQPD